MQKTFLMRTDVPSWANLICYAEKNEQSNICLNAILGVAA